MSSLKNILALICTAILAFPASAALYGFSEGTPHSPIEDVLSMPKAPRKIINYRAELRNNINALASYARRNRKGFAMVIHEGEVLLEKSLWEFHLRGYENARRLGINADDPTFLLRLKQTSPDTSPLAGSPQRFLIGSLDGIALNDLFCSDRKPSDSVSNSGLRIISIDKCKDVQAFDEAIEKSVKADSLLYAFIDPESAFNKIRRQPIINENSKNIFTVREAKNIKLLIDDSLYKSKDRMIDDIADSNYDIIVIEPLFHGTEPFTAEEVNDMKFKKIGSKRMILALHNITEARDTAPYWRRNWIFGQTQLLARPSFSDKNAFIVEYWQDEWKNIMGRYFKAIVDTGYDGAFLTGLENHRFFEKQTPLE